MFSLTILLSRSYLNLLETFRVFANGLTKLKCVEAVFGSGISPQASGGHSWMVIGAAICIGNKVVRSGI